MPLILDEAPRHRVRNEPIGQRRRPDHRSAIIGSMTTTEAPVTVVTGANSGIGRAIAIHLAGRGHTVYGTVRSVDKATKLNAMAAEAGVEVKLVELDVADDDSVA